MDRDPRLRGPKMKRRHFVLGLAPALALYAMPALSQTAGRPPLVGFVVPGTTESHGKWVAAFVKHLAELGWVDGKTVTLDIRYAGGNESQYYNLGEEFARLKAAVVVSSIGRPYEGVVRVSAETPFVMPTLTMGNAFADKYIQSLAHPGGMVTGMSMIGPSMAAKRLEILAELLPGLKRLAILAVKNDQKREPETAGLNVASKPLDIECQSVTIESADEIAPAIAALAGKVQAVYIIIDPLFSVHQVELNKLALEAKLPTMYAVRSFVAAGGLVSYGADFEELFRRSAEYVDKILRGAKPGDLPIDQATKFNLVINLKTADALGVTIPPVLLASVEELIE
jgi:putative ABC transport system substrate-binding protein